ncbi:MAG TPA: hypothetical protein VGO67_03810 [Verrucomicrobiae bacterium]
MLPTQAHAEAALPPDVKAVWDLSKEYRETTPTRERQCVNGFWRWQPAADNAVAPPTTGWGYYKVPACWPGAQDYMQSDYQTLYPDASWKDIKLRDVQSAWYERSITIPENWAGRRIALDVEYLNSYAKVFIDGKSVGEIRFPAGEVDLSSFVHPGATHVLSLLVIAMPLHAVMESYNDTNAARKKKGSVQRSGLCGDVWLVSEPAKARLGDVRIDTSFRKGEITFNAALKGLLAGEKYKLRGRITDHGSPVAEFAGPAFSASDVKEHRASFTVLWKPTKLWDITTPENQFDAEVTLLDADGVVMDVASPVRFGFRELWIEGRDFYLNGTRLYLSLVPLDNAEVGAALATYDAARESFLRLKSFGINFVYTHNYGCEPGSHLSFDEILRAADDTGMLVALSQPHFSQYEWQTPDADQTNGYAGHAAFYVHVAASHPSVVCYSMSHNATGYNEAENPAMIDGLSNPRDQWSERNVKRALRCEAIVNHLDPSRIVYHHESGNLSAMYTLNFYLNFVPSQELDDWFEHWSTAGVKPLVLVEYGVPFGWDWTMYRGWYNGQREFGGAAVPWEYCLAEWNAQFIGDAAYKISDREKTNLRWEAEQFRKGRLWNHWEYPYPVGDSRLDEMQPVQAAYTTDNWRAFRTWGLSANSPWEHDRFWKLRDGFQHQRQNLHVDWDNLQRPGFSPDFIDKTFERFDLAYERSDWVATPTAQSLMRNNMPLLGWIGGKPEHFTTKDHTFKSGEKFQKQLIVINNSRETVTCDASWSCDLGSTASRSQQFVIRTGDQVRSSMQIEVPANVAPGDYHVNAKFMFSTGEMQTDSFTFQVLPSVSPQPLTSKIALFDPPGQTAKLLTELGVPSQAVDSTADLSKFDILLIGKGALTVDGAAPDLRRVRDGLKVVVFEQTGDVLEKRLGFRVEEYGMRQVWPRAPDSPLLTGLTSENLRDWRGSSTILPPTLSYKLSQRYNGVPSVIWCGLEMPRLWRCGNWGNVASVMIEKPSRGDFLPIVDCGYALQYSPLLEYHEGRGMVLFCQMDVTGRTEDEPAAKTLARNILRYVDAWKPSPRRNAVYAGDADGRKWLAACGIDAKPLKDLQPAKDQVLVIGSGASREIVEQSQTVREWAKAGGRVLALGLDQAEADAILPNKVTMESVEHIAAFFPPFHADSLLAGVSPADIHNRDPRKMPLVAGGASIYGDGVLATEGNVVFCQLPPYEVSKTFGALRQEGAAHRPEMFNQRRTFERSSFAVSRILGNLGVSGSTPLLERVSNPVKPAQGVTGGRWLDGFYLTQPTEWDDPYRFFGW